MSNNNPKHVRVSLTECVGEIHEYVQWDEDPKNYSREEYERIIDEAQQFVEKTQSLLTHRSFSTQENYIEVEDRGTGEHLFVGMGIGPFETEEYYLGPDNWLTNLIMRLPNFLHRPFLFHAIGISKKLATCDEWMRRIDVLRNIDLSERDNAILKVQILLRASVESSMRKIS